MSISSEITRLQGAKNTLKTKLNAINNSENQITNETIDEYGDYVDSIGTNISTALSTLESDLDDLTELDVISTEQGENVTLTDCKEKELNKFKLLGKTEQATVILPSEYTQVEYIEGDGSQYLDTGVALTSNFGIDMVFQYTEVVGSTIYGNILGCSDGTNAIYMRQNDGNYSRYRFGTSAKYDTILQNTSKHIVIWRGTNLKIDSTSYTFTSQTFTTTKNVYLFGLNPASGSVDTTKNAKAKLYYAKIYDGTTLVRNYVPCKRNSDNEVGLYDLVNNTFTSSSTTNFTAGSTVVLPTSDFPIEIKNVEGKNIASLETSATKSIGGIAFTTDNGIININGQTTNLNNNFYFNSFRTQSKDATFWIEVDGYSISPGSSNAYLILQQSSDNSTWSSAKEIGLQPNSTKIQQITLDNSKYYRIRLYVAINTFTNATIKVQLEYGTQKTSFVPYNTIQIKKVNKNLLDKTNNLFQGVFSTSSGGDDSISSSNNNCCTKKIDITNITNLIFSGSTNFELFSFYKNDGTFISYTTNNPSTVPENAQYVRLRFYNSSALTLSDLQELDLQLEAGSTATDYVAHAEKTYYFPLSTGQKLMQGGIIDGKVKNNRNHVILDGVTNNKKITNVSYNSSSGLYYCYGTMFTDAKYTATNSAENLVCTHFKAKVGLEVGNCYRTGNGYALLFVLTDQTITTASGVNAWLAQQYTNGTPVEVEYPLETPSSTDFTASQQTVYDEIISDGTYEGITYYIANGDLTPKMDITYYKNIENTLDGILEDVTDILSEN